MTSQNHGFAVEPSDAERATHVSLYDGTVEASTSGHARALDPVPPGGRVPAPHDAWPILEGWVEELAS